MDRRQMIVQRAREYFGDRLDDVLHMVRQDRNDMRGWQEPAHVRAAVRRTIREEGSSEPGGRVSDTTATDVAYSFPEFSRTAGEPERGQQREAIGQLLESGATALEKVSRNPNDLNGEEVFALEAVLLLYARPALLVGQNRLASASPFWNLLEDQRDDIEVIQRGVGRIELYGHPEFDWAGTGFLVTNNLLMTTRRTAELFAEFRNDAWQFRPGISAWMDYRTDYQGVSSAGYRVRSIFGVHPNYDLALMEVEPPHVNGNAPIPLALAAQAPRSFEGRPVYLVGYPIRDARRNEPEPISRIFRDVYNVKRVQPGVLRGEFRFGETPFLRHDCAPLGQTAGSPILDLETHEVLGMQLTGRYLETGTAVPFYALRDDPFFRRANVTFTNPRRQEEREEVTFQIERLTRTPFWNEVRTTIENLYQRAFGR